MTGNFFADARSYPHTGSKYAYLANADGSKGNSISGTASQTFTVPDGSTNAKLSFWYNITTDETTTTVAYDTMTVTITNTSGSPLATVASFSNLNHGTAGVYQQRTFDLTPYVGQTIRVKFSAANDSTLATVFRVDDVSATVSTSVKPVITAFDVTPKVITTG